MSAPRHQGAQSRAGRFARWIAAGAACVFACTVASGAPATSPLDRFLDGLKTLRADFTQTVNDAKGRKVDGSRGTLIVSRPGKFRWEVKAAGDDDGAGQVLVADGRNLWFYDRDLEQVTVKPMDAALSATPAMLLSGAADVREAFEMTTVGRRDGLDWVHVEPKRADADFRGALLGFDGSVLTRMILEDKLGQTTTVEFSHSKRNAPVNPSEVSFSPPQGVDVIGKPAQ